MEIQEIISDVYRANNDLTALAADESVTFERLAKCDAAAASDLETAAIELLTTAWIPKLAERTVGRCRRARFRAAGIQA